MDQLISLVTEKTGISDENARAAVDTVVEFLKDKLPAPIASQVTAALEGEGDIADQAKSALGGFFS